VGRRGDENDDNDDDGYVAPSGLASRRRLHQSYEITQQNDVERQGGNQDAFITVSNFSNLFQGIFSAFGTH
jgi:nuclear receptor interaction protein